MDDLIPCRNEGDIMLRVPLAPQFQQILQNFVRIAVVKSGFSREESSRIAQRISSRIFQKLSLAVEQANHQQVEISVCFKDQEEFKSR
jgi:hypothetical protein